MIESGRFISGEESAAYTLTRYVTEMVKQLPRKSPLMKERSHLKNSTIDCCEKQQNNMRLTSVKYVVKYREEFLEKLKGLKGSHMPPPPCRDETASTPPLDAEIRKKVVLIYHDESIFNTHEG